MSTATKQFNYTPTWDVWGTYSSTLCIMHCILIPVVIAFAPFAGLEVLQSEIVHKALVLMVAAISIPAFYRGYLIHRKKTVLALMMTGLTLLFAAAFFVEIALSNAWAETAETLFTVVGGLAMVSAHLFNRSFCRACPECCEKEFC